MVDAAIETFGKIGQRRKWKQDYSKPWFDKNCSKNRTIIHKARKRYSFLKNAENRRKIRLASKEYKASLNRAFTEYQQTAAEELRNVSKKPSFPKALPFFYLSTTFFISFSVIGLFRN
jgi:hypothetical protein